MITNICFHGIGECTREREPGEAAYWVADDTFLRTLDVLAGIPTTRISFDDGNRSDVERALPALLERGLTATFFALAGRLDDPASLSASDLHELHDVGMRIGTHGWSHMSLARLGDADARREVIDARVALEEASGATVTDIALPLGRYDRALLQRLKAQRYRSVFTSDRFRARPGSWLQARFSVTAADGPESVRSIASRRLGAADARNLAKSVIKRLR